MQRFKSPEQAQRFLETFSAVCNHLRPRRHRLLAGCYRQIMRERFQQWPEIAHLDRQRERGGSANYHVVMFCFRPVLALNLSMPFRNPRSFSPEMHSDHQETRGGRLRACRVAGRWRDTVETAVF
jgi:putative transposase